MLNDTPQTSRAPTLLAAAVLVMVLLPGASTSLRAQTRPPTSPDTEQEPEEHAKGATLIVDLVGFEDSKGKARVALFTSEEGYPSDWKAAHARRVLPLESTRIRVTFRDISATTIALSAFHDRNDDGELNTGLFGAPTEAYGASNDARNTFSPPDWDQARVDLAAGETKHLTIQIH